ncbi:MAG: 3,4-dihydroxy-2-butanone-4-phosphate synthase, partial [Candidatus Muiribacteriota bacterium]
MIASVKKAVEYLKNGKTIIIVDDEDRENEGDFMFAGEFATPELVNFMAKEGRGLICVAMEGKRLEELNIPMMVENNTSQFTTGFTVSVEARNNVTTGISAHDRAHTIKLLANPESRAG